jgi:hypothetical protein
MHTCISLIDKVALASSRDSKKAPGSLKTFKGKPSKLPILLWDINTASGISIHDN